MGKARQWKDSPGRYIVYTAFTKETERLAQCVSNSVKGFPVSQRITGK